MLKAALKRLYGGGTGGAVTDRDNIDESRETAAAISRVEQQQAKGENKNSIDQTSTASNDENGQPAGSSSSLVESPPSSTLLTAIPGLSFLQTLKRSLSPTPSASAYPLALSRSSTSLCSERSPVLPISETAREIATIETENRTHRGAQTPPSSTSTNKYHSNRQWHSVKGKGKVSTPPLSCCSKEVADDPFARVCPSPPAKHGSSASSSNTSSRSHSPTVSLHSPPSVSDYFPTSPLSKSFGTSTTFSSRGSSTGGSYGLPLSSSSFGSSSNSNSRQISLSTSATSQSSFLSSTSQDTIVTSSEATSNHYFSPISPLDDDQLRRSFSSKKDRDGSPYSRQRSTLSFKRTVTSPILPTLKDGEPFCSSLALPQLVSHVHCEGMFAASHASAPPVSSATAVKDRKGLTSRFIEHLDIALSAPSDVDLELCSVLPPVASTFAALGIETTGVPPMQPSRNKYGSLPLLRTKSRDLLSSKKGSIRKMSATSIFSGNHGDAPTSRKSSDSFVLLSSPNGAPPAGISEDYPFFGADGSIPKEGRPVFHRKGRSLPLLSGSRNRSSGFIPVIAAGEEAEMLCGQDENGGPVMEIREQRNSMPFVSSLIPRSQG